MDQKTLKELEKSKNKMVSTAAILALDKGIEYEVAMLEVINMLHEGNCLQDKIEEYLKENEN